MARVDKYLKAMSEARASELFLAPDAEIAFRVGGSLRKVGTQKLPQAILLSLLNEVMPPGGAKQLADTGSLEFPYEAPGGPAVSCRAIRAADRVQVVFSLPEGAAGAGSDSAPATAAVGPAALATAVAPAAPVPSPAATSGERRPAAPAGAAPGPATAGTETASEGAPSAAGPAARAAGVPAPDNEPEIHQLFRFLVEQQGSDLHLSPGERPILRLWGDMTRLADSPVCSPGDTARMLLPVMPTVNRAEFEERNDTDFGYQVDGLGRFRCNVFRDRKGMGGVFRVIPTRIPTVEDLGLSKEIQALCQLNKGLVLVTGPTGSGKSTTLASLVDLINRTRKDHVITIEDPIEFIHENKECLINQREVGIHTESFKGALRAALREDPDIVLVGEMRDLETVAIAIETAETGHLVFGTLHTSTAASTVDRIVDQFPADQQNQIRVMLAESLRGVLSQTLCKKVGGGRIAAMEVLIVTSAVGNLIREGKTFQIPTIIQTNKKLGMLLLNDALTQLVKERKVEPREAYLKAMDKSGLLGQFKREGVDTRGLEGAD